MSYTDECTYSKVHEFTSDDLIGLTPDDVYYFLAFTAYGKPDPQRGVDFPIEGRHTTLEYFKKAISFFMPNKHLGWDVLHKVGNPTKSVPVLDLIKAVKKSVTRGEGRKSQARHALTQDEFKHLIKTLRNSDNVKRACSISAYFIFQYNMIGRLDDVAHVFMEKLKPHHEFTFSLQTQMCWSKNVSEERDAPQQILLGAMDESYCVFLALSIHLEIHLQGGDGFKGDYPFGIYGGSPENTKKQVATCIHSVFDTNAAFDYNRDDELGTHGIRKLAGSFAANNSCSPSEVELRGRWKSEGRKQVNTYINTTLPYPDAKVAAILCVGGPINYVEKEGYGIGNDFLLAAVVPHINRRFGADIAVLLGLPLLWACMDTTFKSWLPSDLVNPVVAEYEKFRTMDVNENSVDKVRFLVTGNGGNLRIDEMCGTEENSGVCENGPYSHDNAMIQAIYSQVRNLRASSDELKSSLNVRFGCVDQKMSVMGSNLNRIAAQPFLRKNGLLGQSNRDKPPQEGNVVASSSTEKASYAYTLYTTPKTLDILWEEYEFGIGGRVPAKNFTSIQRGKVKHSYARRKIIWDCILNQISKGYTAQTACKRIYDVYSHNTSVTKIINKMKLDKKRDEMHENLKY